MAYLLYKYVRDKRRAKKAREAGGLPAELQSNDGLGPTSKQTKDQLLPEELYHLGPMTLKRSTVSTVVLLVALAFPVYLETLDYTGACSSANRGLVALFMVPSASRRHSTTNNRISLWSP